MQSSVTAESGFKVILFKLQTCKKMSH